ncbi:MAG: acyltransferase, partial [Chitinophagaceae bacterium]
MRKEKHIFGLEIVRAVAILSVLLAHLFYLFRIKVGPLEQMFVWDGVIIFFVLSGYLIGGILLRATEEPFGFRELRSFWMRRWFRTLPAYFAVVFLLVAHFVWIHGWSSRLVEYFFFLQSIGNGQAPFYPESWSLCVEEWFYLLVPIAMLAAPRRNRKYAVLGGIITVILLGTGWRLWQVATNYPLYQKLLLNRQPFARFDGIAFGLLAAWMQHFSVVRHKRRLFWAGLLLLLLMQVNVSFYGQNTLARYGWCTLFPMGTMLTLPYLATVKTGSGVFSRFVSFTAL